MFDVLLSGKLRGTPEVRQSRTGNPFATFRLNVPTGKDGGYVQASCITFSQTAMDVLSGLVDGDALAVNGEAVIKQWQGKNGMQAGLDVTVHNAMSAYMVKKKRGTAAGDTATSDPAEPLQCRGSTEAQPTRSKFHHPDFEQPNLSGPDPEGWGSLDGV